MAPLILYLFLLLTISSTYAHRSLQELKAFKDNGRYVPDVYATPGIESKVDIAEIASILRQPAPLHGSVQKDGFPANLTTLMMHMTNLDADHHGIPFKFTQKVNAWFATSYSFKQGFLDPEKVPKEQLRSPVPTCHYYVDHTYQTVYVRTTKTGGTSISQTLGFKENPMVCRSNPGWCNHHCEGKQLCMEYITDPKQVENLLSKYFVFTMVRNPFTRAVSSYNHVHKYAIKPECRVPFKEFAKLPNAYAAECFINPSCCNQRYGWVLEHVELQTPCFMTKHGTPAVDYIGRVEEIDTDFPELVKLINEHRPGGSVPELELKSVPKLMTSNVTGDRDVEDRYASVYASDAAALEHVLAYYEPDFDLLGYSDIRSNIADLVTRNSMGGVVAPLPLASIWVWAFVVPAFVLISYTLKSYKDSSCNGKRGWRY